jgi:hypothetical protein
MLAKRTQTHRYAAKNHSIISTPQHLNIPNQPKQMQCGRPITTPAAQSAHLLELSCTSTPASRSPSVMLVRDVQQFSGGG